MNEATRYCEGPDDTGPCVVRDGTRLRVGMTLMDSGCGCGGDTKPVIDTERAEADRRQIAAAHAHATAVQRHADYFAGLADGAEAERRENESQAAYEDRIALAWKHAPTGA